ncbi:MAG: ribonuclease III [Lentisphaerae bacterium]|nr:ribonuclease III [Lentisphaerota bacterium]
MGDNEPGADALEERLGYRFRDRALLDLALTHRSYRFEHNDSNADNERLEFLGDSVIGFIVSEWLYGSLEDEEGVLSAVRSSLISGRTLAGVAVRLGLGGHLKLGVGELKGDGRERASNLSDAFEAITGAVYLDGGMRACRRVVRALLADEFARACSGGADSNPKGRLQQYSQAKWRRTPKYTLVEEIGPAHRRRFLVSVVLPDGMTAEADGTSRRRAEAAAAVVMLKQMEAGGGL